MKAYDACPKCRTIDYTEEWNQTKSDKAYYCCVCHECYNQYYQTYRGQGIGETDPKLPIQTFEIKPKLIDPIPYIQDPEQSPPRERGKDATSQARL